MISTENFQDALEPIAIKNFQVGFKEIPSERDVLFSVKTSKKLMETYLELGDVGVMPELTGDLEYEDVEQGYKMTITAKEYAKGMQIKRKFVLTDQLDIVEGLPKLIGLAARRRIAADVCAFLNDAFNTSLTTIDGLQLCSTAHTSNNGGSNQSNSGTTAFSEPQVDAVRILMKNFGSNTDELYEVTPDLLIVPRELEKAAYELISSSGKVDTANNNANFHKGKYKVLVLDRLDDTNNWFFADSELLKIMNVWNNVDPLNFGQAENFDGVAARYRGYMFYGYGTRDWRPIYGSNVT
jgi:phage major head subunit gpT-like protein